MYPKKRKKKETICVIALSCVHFWPPVTQKREEFGELETHNGGICRFLRSESFNFEVEFILWI